MNNRLEAQVKFAESIIDKVDFDNIEALCHFMFRNRRSMLLSSSGFVLLKPLFKDDDLGIYDIEYKFITSRNILSLSRNLEGPYYLTKSTLILYDPEEIFEMNLIGGDISTFTKLKKI